MPTPSVSGSFEVLTLGLTLGNGSGTDFGASQCIPMGPCRLTLGVFIPLEHYDNTKIYNEKKEMYKSVADPGFSPGGGGVRHLPKLLLFFKFLLKTA